MEKKQNVRIIYINLFCLKKLKKKLQKRENYSFNLVVDEKDVPTLEDSAHGVHT